MVFSLFRGCQNMVILVANQSSGLCKNEYFLFSLLASWSWIWGNRYFYNDPSSRTNLTLDLEKQSKSALTKLWFPLKRRSNSKMTIKLTLKSHHFDPKSDPRPCQFLRLASKPRIVTFACFIRFRSLKKRVMRFEGCLLDRLWGQTLKSTLSDAQKGIKMLQNPLAKTPQNPHFWALLPNPHFSDSQPKTTYCWVQSPKPLKMTLIFSLFIEIMTLFRPSDHQKQGFLQIP